VTVLFLLAFINGDAMAIGKTQESGSNFPFIGNQRAEQVISMQGNPVVTRVYFTNQEDLNQLASSLDIWEVKHPGGYLVSLVRPEQLQQLLQAGYRVEIDEVKTGEMTLPHLSLPGQTDGIPGLPCYRTVEETYASMADIVTGYPNLATLMDIGDSWDKSTLGGPSGYDIYALVLTNKMIPGPKPKFFLMAEIHARELPTAELAMRFAEYLVQDYGLNPDVTWLLDYFEVHILPMTNPDGRKMVEPNLPTRVPWRKNTDNDDGCTTSPNYGTDLNRNHSFHWGGVGSSGDPCSVTYRGPSSNSEPETRAIQTYVNSIFPDQRGPAETDPAPKDAMGVFITLHSYGELVLFPWGFTPDPPPNDTELETLGRKFGFFNKYQVCQSGEDGCIYLTSGSSDDWAYGRLGVAAYTFEMGTSFFQSCSVFENTVLPNNLPALLYAFKASRRPYQNPTGPETLNALITPTWVISGTLVTLSASADDTRFDSNDWGNEPSQNISAARYSIDTPSWITETLTLPMSASDGAYNESVEGIQASINTSKMAAGRHIIFIESQDAIGNWGVPTAVFLWIEPLNTNRVYLPVAARR
jgi:hypothetical protein